MQSLIDYEGMFIIDPSIGQEAIDQQIEEIKGLVAKYEGTISNEEKIGQKKLAYEIQKKREGFYYLIHFSLNPDAVSKLENVFRINDNILRNLIIVNELENVAKS